MLFVHEALKHNIIIIIIINIRDCGGCLYTVIQWKTAARVLQSGNWANRTVEAKVRTIQKTIIPVLSRENAPARHFLLLILLLPAL